ncbi:MAG: hypothetical protein ACFFDH_06210 [Promethearchaeota archaeon]
MKILFFPLYPKTPYLETDMELISNHLDKNDKVFICNCKGNLEKCFMTLEYNKLRCIDCQIRRQAALKYLNIPEENIIPLKDLEIDYGILPEKFENVRELMEFKIYGHEFGLATASNLILHFEKNHKFNTIKYKDDVQKHLRAAIYIYHFMTYLLKKLKPDVLYLFNGRFNVPRCIIFACEDTNTTYYTYERAGTIKRYALRKNTIPHDLKRSKEEMEELWNCADKDKKIKISEEWFIERRKGIDQGWFSYTKHQKEALLPKDYNSNKKIITIYNSTMEESYTLNKFINFSLYTDEIHGIEKLVKNQINNSEIHFYLRIHPNLEGYNNFQIQSYRRMDKKYKNLTVIYPYEKVNSYTLLDHSDIVITFGSTIGVEATFWGKPSILLRDSSYYDKDISYQPKTHQDLIELLLEPNLKPKVKSNALKYGYWQKKRGIKYKKYTPFTITSGVYETFHLLKIKLPLIISIKLIIIKRTTKLLFEKIFNPFIGYRDSKIKKKMKDIFVNFLVKLFFIYHQ